MFKRAFKAFEYRDFRIQWIGACTSSIGTWMQSLAQSWLVYELSKNPFFLGLDSFLGQFPIMLLSLVGGVFADRINRRNILLMSQYVQMSCAFLLTILIATHVVAVWHILSLSFVVGIAQAFGSPAYQALLPSLVGKEDYSNAIALNSIQFNLARVIGPSLGGIALASLGAVWCFGLNGISFLAVITTLYMINVKYIPARSSEPILTSMKCGIRFIRQSEGMELLILLAFVMTLLGIPLTVFLPVFAKEVFQQGPSTYTLLLVCSGTGSVAGALAVAGLGRVKRQGLTALLFLTAQGFMVFGFSLSKWLPLACGFLFCAGACMMGTFSMVSSLVQSITTDEMRGRVMSVYNVAFRGGMPIGSLILGRLIPIYGVSATMAGAGLLLATIALYLLLVHRRIAAL